MKLLLSCVGDTPYSLIGFDWDVGKVFWTLEHQYLVCQGICYDNNHLLATCGSVVTRVRPEGGIVWDLGGQFNPQTHGIHLIDDNTYGISDIGNTRVIVCDRKTDKIIKYLSPVSEWGSPGLPEDSIHMNDFIATPFGILTTAFNHQPWRNIRDRISVRRWFEIEHGIIFNLTGDGEETGGRIVASGLTHPHTLMYVDPFVYCLSASKSLFHMFELSAINKQTLVEKFRFRIAEGFWLRGACCIGTRGGVWYIGGIRSPYLRDHDMAKPKQGELSIFKFTDMHVVEEKAIGISGSVYDVIPWRDDVMNPLVAYFDKQKKK